MRKLLHERLRDEENPTSCAIRNRILGIDGCIEKGGCSECAKHAVGKLADEIEWFYVPLPRYEDGEPLNPGDPVAWVDESLGERLGEVTAIHIDYSGNVLVDVADPDGVEATIDADRHGAFKRDKNRALGADGTAVCKDDTVYVSENYSSCCRSYDIDRAEEDQYWLCGVSLDKALTVKDVMPDGKVIFSFRNAWCPAYMLTHEKPDCFKDIVESLSQLVNEEERDAVSYDEVADILHRFQKLIARGGVKHVL